MGAEARRARRVAGAAPLALAVLWACGTSAPAAESASLDPAAIVLVRDGYLFAVPPGAGASGRIAVRQEAQSAAAITALGGRSARIEAIFDCAQKRSSVDSVRVYPGVDLGGGAGVAVAPAAWLHAHVTAWFDVSDAVCDSSRPRLRAGPGAAPPVPPADPDRSPSQGATAHPAASKLEASQTGEPHFAQLGAFATATGAEAQWSRITASPATGLAGAAHRIEPVPHEAATLSRLLAGPFPTRGAAEARCAAARAAGFGCLVR